MVAQRAKQPRMSTHGQMVGIQPIPPDLSGLTGMFLVLLPQETRPYFLTWMNREFDPWKESGVSSSYRPGGPLQSTTSAPLHVIPGGFHCSDLILKNGAANKGAQKVIDAEVTQIKTWVKEYYH